MESAWTTFIHLLCWSENSLVYRACAFIIFFEAMTLVCAHFPWNNLYLLEIKEYFSEPILFLKFNFFCMSMIN